MLMLVIAVALTGVIATPSYADEAAPSPTAAATTPSAEDVSANIVDTQNLLGDNLGAVTDAIKETYERTGVTVRLIYVNSFNTDKQPDAWAAQTLKSLDPPPNTVLLAVASNDGNLAVVVSPDSAEWLRNRKTVDKLSEAASAPLTDDADANGPNWAKSAIDMMQAIQTAKSTSTSSTAASVGIIVMIGAVAVLLIGAVVVIVVRRRRETERDAERVVEDGEAQDDDARKGTAETAQASDADPASGGASVVVIICSMSNETSIVVVDDEPSIRELLVASLHFAGYEVETAASGSEAIEVIEKTQPDLIILDVMLPDIDGFTVTRRIRQEGIDAPVLFLTARDDTQDKVMGLTVGGDDYVTKPFSLEEVVARIRAILRRTREQEQDDPIIRVGDLEINEDSHDVTRAGKPIELSPTEYKLLRYLMDNKGRVLSKAQILDHVWQYDWGGDAAIVESYISYLRKKVDDLEVEDEDGTTHKVQPLIETKRGIGYMIRVPKN